MNAPSDLSIERRTFLKGALAAGALLPLSGFLASCAASGSTSSGGATGAVSGKNPFGVAKNSTVDAVIFNGGYGVDYAKFAATVLEKEQAGVKVKVSPSTQIAQELQPRFVGGNPPDVIDDSGANLIGINTILGDLEDLNSVVNAKNLEGTTIKDTLYPGVLAPGLFGNKLAAINYVLTVFALWHSESLFQQNGWQVPKTWDEAMSLGAKAKAKGKFLFGWGKEAATYYLTMAIESAIKEGGDDVRLALDNLQPKCWSHPAVQSTLNALEKIVKAGYVKPGGSGTQFTAAQAQWSNAEQFLLYPSGSWIENEMKSQTKAGFKMTGSPTPTVSSGAKMPFTALHSASAEAYIVPSKASNAAGGKEFMRVMLSKEAAANFAKSTLASTIVKDTIPPDAFGSTALKSQLAMLKDAGNDVFTWGFVDRYGLNTDLLVLWNGFLAGNVSVPALTAGMQKITDKVANDSSVKKVKVS
jgi:N-acetylglucosamine transport system substrate-binding protein